MQTESLAQASDGPEPSLSAPRRILLVDDELHILRSVQRILRGHGWDITTAKSAEEGLAQLDDVKPIVVISDYRMPGMNGVQFLAEVKLRLPHTQRVLLTGQADFSALEDAVNQSEIFRFVAKPWNNSQLLLTVQSAVEQYDLHAENKRLYQLTTQQNDQLRELNADLETRVQLRTHLLSLAKREWERSFDSLEVPLTVTRGDRTLTRANRAAAKLGSRVVQEVANNPPCHKYLFGRDTPCESCPLEKALESGGTAEAEVVHEDRTYVVSASDLPSDGRAVMTYRDVTEERAHAQQQADTDKMAAVGQLAGGVAHEINNPLGGILAFVQLMRREEGRSESDREGLALIEESALRCKRIVHSLLQFSRRSRPEEKRRFNVASCVSDAAYLFRAQLTRAPGVELALELDPELPDVFGDPAQLGQVVLNLLQNGLHALPDERGSLRVRTRRQDDRCVVEVTDTGTGISPEHLKHIFEPSFTTKPPGQGTGLGLSIVYRIVKEHGGTIQVRTALGEGSTFRIFLPIPITALENAS